MHINSDGQCQLVTPTAQDITGCGLVARTTTHTRGCQGSEHSWWEGSSGSSLPAVGFGVNATRLIPLRPQHNWHTPPVTGGWRISAPHRALSLPYGLGGCYKWTRCFVRTTAALHSQPAPYSATPCQQVSHDFLTSGYSPHYCLIVVWRTSLVRTIVSSPLTPPTHAIKEIVFVTWRL